MIVVARRMRMVRRCLREGRWETMVLVVVLLCWEDYGSFSLVLFCCVEEMTASCLKERKNARHMRTKRAAIGQNTCRHMNSRLP